MKTFEEYMNENYSGQFDMPHQSETYKAGQESRQSEIDELKAKLDTEKSIRSMSEHLNNTKQAEIDELKAKLAKVESGEWVIVPKTITQKISDKLFAEHDLDEDRASYIYEDAIEAAQEK